MKKCMDSANLHRRLAKIGGQVKAIDRMVDEDVPCEDILTQISAAKSALNKVGQIVLEGHISHCIKKNPDYMRYPTTRFCPRNARCSSSNQNCRNPHIIRITFLRKC